MEALERAAALLAADLDGDDHDARKHLRRMITTMIDGAVKVTLCDGDGRSGIEPWRARMTCARCDDEGWVCEKHPDTPWREAKPDRRGCDCGAGEPCSLCNPSDRNHPPRMPRGSRELDDDEIDELVDRQSEGGGT